MNEITMSEMKVIALDILRSVADFCDKNGIYYLLAYGTMLGAIRHKGFIPWDDDIDIMMPRKDYLKFINTYNGFNDRYIVRSIENDENYTYTMAKVFDTHTVLKDLTLWHSYEEGGVFVDIFPIDGLPDDKLDQQKVFRHQQWLNLLFHGSCMRYAYSHKYVDSKDKRAAIKGFLRTMMKFVAVTVMHPLPSGDIIHKINLDAEKYDFESSAFVSVLVDCAQGNKREVLPKEKILDRKRYNFEDCEFWGIKDYDYYLKHLFNDYMIMPPKNRRIPHHNFKVYWRDSCKRV